MRHSSEKRRGGHIRIERKGQTDRVINREEPNMKTEQGRQYFEIENRAAEKENENLRRRMMVF